LSLVDSVILRENEDFRAFGMNRALVHRRTHRKDRQSPPGGAKLRSVSGLSSVTLSRGPVIDIRDAPSAGDRTSVSHPQPEYVRLGAVAAGKHGAAYDTLDDATLGALIGDRDSSAIEELYDRHGSACYGLARRVVADEQLAQDVVQEVFLAIWRGAATYDGSRGSLSTWLFALTHHKSVDAVRRSQRHTGRRASEDALNTEPDPTPAVEEQAMASVRRGQVRAALAELPDPQRQALMLAYFGGYSQSEIAQLTGIPLGTVKTRTLAAMRRLRQVLAEGQLHVAATDGEGG
jgi:RNA polymerase sigma factor (sigma-70 family)